MAGGAKAKAATGIFHLVKNPGTKMSSSDTCFFKTNQGNINIFLANGMLLVG